MSKELVLPIPGRDVIPEGWWKKKFLPWVQQQSNSKSFKGTEAQLAALEAAYNALGIKTLELMKARRCNEAYWGVALGPGKRGGDHRESKSLAGDLLRMDRHRYRQLGAEVEKVLTLLGSYLAEEQCTRAALLRAIGGAHVGKNAGNNEWYTPPEYIEAARAVLGEIDLDPASTAEANERIKAKVFYSVHDDGLSHDWAGRIWMNPPYAAELIRQFCKKLVDHYNNGDVSAAIVLVNNATETKWAKQLEQSATALCRPTERIRFLNSEGEEGHPLQGQEFYYFGKDIKKFTAAFVDFCGRVWI